VIGAELAAWDKTFEVNLRGYFILTKLVYEASMEKSGGAIVNISSIGGIRPGLGLGVYNITKAGVIMLTASSLESSAERFASTQSRPA
jgi:NAD(P)-dependent dehydrogenase (short-subunit alcohol dehydrogenase family)